MTKESQMRASAGQSQPFWKNGSLLCGGLLAVVVLGSSLLGCGGGNGGGTICDDGRVQASWDVVGGCFPGDIVVIRVDGDNSSDRSFDCNAGVGNSVSVEGGFNHVVDLTLFDATDAPVEQSPALSIFVPCGTVASTPIYDFNP
jgi:hypothetical protein